MECIYNIIKKIDELIKSDADSLKGDLKQFIEVDKTLKLVDKLENMVYNRIREQQRFYIREINKQIRKASIADILNLVRQNLFTEDDFVKKFGTEFKSFLKITTKDLTNSYIKKIDKDLAFTTWDKKTIEWINNWSYELAELMQINTHTQIESILTRALREGSSIDTVEQELMKAYCFSRTRARTTAITEMLTAHSAAAYSGYKQNPSVDILIWRHSGGKGIKPRPAHVALDGTEIQKNGLFNVNGYEARYPRDTNLPAGERVNCHCVLQAGVNKDVLGLSLEERKKLQQQAIKDMDLL